MVNTAEMGYTQGYAGYKIIENVGRYFLVMQADATDFQELVQLLDGAGGLRKLSPCPVLTQPDARGTDPSSLCSGYFLCRGFDRPGIHRLYWIAESRRAGPGRKKGEITMHQVLMEKIPYFSDDGLSCAESTLRYLIEHGYADLPLDTVRIMTGLHGNMGRCANCGAVNGSVAAIGANFGRREVGEDMTLLYELTERFMQEFEQTFGSVKCAELMEGKDPALMEQQHKCADIVAGAVDIAARIIEEGRAAAKK